MFTSQKATKVLTMPYVYFQKYDCLKIVTWVVVDVVKRSIIKSILGIPYAHVVNYCYFWFTFSPNVIDALSNHFYTFFHV